MKKQNKKSPAPKSKATPAEPKTSDDVLVSATELAEWLNLGAGRITDLAAGAVVRASHGKYWLKASVQKYCGLKNGKNKTEARDRTDNAKAELVEIELAQKRAELAPIAEFEKEWTDIALRVRSKIQTIPNKASARLAGKNMTAPQIKTVLADLVGEILNEIADYDPDSFVGAGSPASL